MLLPDRWRPLVRGFVINKFRGDPALLGDGPAELERRCGVPTLGCLPWLEGVGVDAEDSIALRSLAPSPGASLDVVAIRFPRISNATDLDPLYAEPDVSVRLVDSAAAFGRPDLVVLPGSKATVSDLEWLRASGLAEQVVRALDARTTVIGICGGYQMLGAGIDDAVESRPPRRAGGLGLLGVHTVFDEEKVTRLRRGAALGHPVEGYEIHHGRTAPADPWIDLSGEPEGACARDGQVLGTALHGLFESDGFRRAFLAGVARRAGRSWTPGPRSFASFREERFDRLAAAVEAHLDVATLEAIISSAPRPVPG